MKFNLKALNKRETYIIYFASTLICILFLIEFIVLPVVDKKKRLERVLQVKIKTFEDMTALKSQYDHIRLKNRVYKGQYGKKEKDFTLFSFLEKHADQTDIKDHITYMKPSSSVHKNTNQKVSSVEMELKGITLNQLVDYLHAVESNENNIIISKLSIIKTGKNAGFINSILHVDAFEATK